MRFILFAILLAIAISLGISSAQMMRGQAGEGALVIAFILHGLGWLVGAVALFILLRRPSVRDFEDSRSVLDLLPDSMRDKIAVVALLFFAALIVFMLVKSIGTGSIVPLLGRRHIHFSINPFGYCFNLALWAALAWLLGWYLPRSRRRGQQRPPSDEAPDD